MSSVCLAAFTGQCQEVSHAILSLLEDVSSHLISHQDSTTAMHADISAFWIALAEEVAQPEVATSAMQWLVHAAQLRHISSAGGYARAIQPDSTAARLAHRLARVQLSESEGSISVSIVSCKAESDSEQRNAGRAQTVVAAAVRAAVQLSRAPSAALRSSAARSALQLLETSQRPFRPQQQAFTEPKAAQSEPSDQHAASNNATTSAEPGSSAARRAAVPPDSTLVQLGQAAVAGVSDVSADVAAAWRQVLDCMAPAIMQIATSASRSTLPAFLLLHEVKLSLRNQ